VFLITPPVIDEFLESSLGLRKPLPLGQPKAVLRGEAWRSSAEPPVAFRHFEDVLERVLRIVETSSAFTPDLAASFQPMYW
jgi:hypothetical protein